MAKRRDLIVIVDDDQAVRDALRFALQLEGFCVHIHSGAAALLQDPDLDRARCVIVDERIKDTDGFALLDTLRARNLDVPAVMLTSHATAGLRERAHRTGVREVLEKPLLGNMLVDSIRGVIGDQPPSGTSC